MTDEDEVYTYTKVCEIAFRAGVSADSLSLRLYRMRRCGLDLTEKTVGEVVEQMQDTLRWCEKEKLK